MQLLRFENMQSWYDLAPSPAPHTLQMLTIDTVCWNRPLIFQSGSRHSFTCTAALTVFGQMGKTQRQARQLTNVIYSVKGLHAIFVN